MPSEDGSASLTSDIWSTHLNSKILTGSYYKHEDIAWIPRHNRQIPYIRPLSHPPSLRLYSHSATSPSSDLGAENLKELSVEE